MRILVVEDDAKIADLLADTLRNAQHTVDIAQDGEIAWDWIKTLDYDLILLDVTLPKLDGLKLCRQVRDFNSTLPILMLTARDTTADKIIGLDAGADDYMVKPFDLDELMARIRALHRRATSSTQTQYLTWGSLRLNADTYEVVYAEQPLTLTPKEYALLELLVVNGRRVLSRPWIIERLWNLEDAPTEEAVKTHIRTLRQKLRLAGAEDDLIETVHGLGYRLKQLEDS